ncbi:MAG: hypothetical protein ACOYL6_08530 [Bacteriovoracaceae bacterium]
MTKIIVGLFLISTFKVFAADQMNCIAHDLRGSDSEVASSLMQLNRYGVKTVSLSNNTINGYSLAIELASNESNSNENIVYPLSKIDKKGKYSIYAINDSYGFLCVTK